MDALLETLSSWIDPKTLGDIALAWGGRVAAALLVFLIGRIIARTLTLWFRRAVGRVGIDDTLTHFFGSLVYIVLLIFVALTAVAILGVPTTNFLAMIGAAGLAIGLAVKDSLSNFSSGVMLVFFRPFKVGDYVEAAGVGGTVEAIGIFNTIVKTPDNRVITIPNSLVYAGTITNYTAEPRRRIDLVIGISYADDVAKAKTLIGEILAADERVLADPAPALLLLELADSSVNIAVRPWVATADYWSVRSDLLERIKRTLEDNGLSIPFPQRDLHIVGQPAPGQ
jgi:small conductance mechanosensitive channel